jgi:peptidoglycan/xylan/chitin deacetylase (PgdA/CDA1 family)
MSILRELFVSALQSETANRAFHFANARKLAILCYHGVTQESLPPEHHQYRTAIRAADFAEHLKWIERRFVPVSAAAVRDGLLGGKALPRHAVLVTFDDGYRNNFAIAAPILRKHGIPAIFFLSTGYIDTGELYWYDELRLRLAAWRAAEIRLPGSSERRPWPGEPAARRALAQRISASLKTVPNEDRLGYLDYTHRETPEWEAERGERELLRPMNWEEARSLAAQGFEIGSHTVDHPILSRLDLEALRRELRASKSRIEEAAGTTCFAIAYPNGKSSDISPAVVAETEAAGYDLGFAMDERLHPLSGDRFRISRVSAPGHAPLGALRVRASGLHELMERGAAAAKTDGMQPIRHD